MESAARPPASVIGDDAMRALIVSLSGAQPSAPTWCTGWSAHELTAHVTGAAEERANLIEEHLAGRPPRMTRSWEEREPPLRALPVDRLRERLPLEAARFEAAVARLNQGDTIEYTGWSMTAERLRMHSHSEAALHRWDLVGDDDVSVHLLAEPAMVTHALRVFDAIPALPEARRWVTSTQPVVLRAGRQPDVVVVPGKGVTTTAHGDGLVVELESHELPLILWGRCPSRLRDPNATAETVDDILDRFAGGV